MIRASAVVFVAWSSAAFAQSAGAQAEVLFRQGRDLMAAGKLTEACTAFEESQHLEPAVTTLLNLAGCREKLGALATAWGLFLEAARQTRWTSDAASQQLHDVAKDRAHKLEPRVSKLTINVPLESQVDGLEITRGADRVGPVLWNRALPIDGGTYTIAAHAPGGSRWSTQVTVAPQNDTKAVEIPDLRNLPRDRPEPAAPPPSVENTTIHGPESPRGSSKTVPLILGAGGLALLGGGLAFEFWGKSMHDAAWAEMMNQSRRESLAASANTRRYFAEALAVCGLAAGGTAVWLYLRDRKRGRGVAATARILVIPTTSSLSLSARF